MLKKKILLIAFHIYLPISYIAHLSSNFEIDFSTSSRPCKFIKKIIIMGEDRQVEGWFNKCKPDFFLLSSQTYYLPICSPVDGRQALQGTISQLAGSVGLHSPYALFFGHLLLSSLLMLCSSCSMDRPVTK